VTAPVAVDPGAEGFPTSDCKACGRRIIWAVTVQRRKPMPVDEAPAKNGNVRLRWEGGGQIAATVVPLKLAFGARGLRLSHFASCPHAYLWSEGRKSMSIAIAVERIGRPNR
jgi:hypothetical protein